MIEIVVTLAALGLILGGLVIVVLSGLKNSQYSKNQIQATKFAQEALDSIRTIKANNCPVKSDGNDYYWTDKDNNDLIWNSSALDKNYKLNFNIVGNSLNIATPCLDDVSPKENINDQFERTINISSDNGANNRIKITAIVSWNDISGNHQSKLVTILSR